jgi:hypothetical protein
MIHKSAILLLSAFLMLASAQELPKANDNVAPSIGLKVGSTAPAFTLRDQFDRTQSNETLKGSDGTILLFFRSADW